MFRALRAFINDDESDESDEEEDVENRFAPQDSPENRLSLEDSVRLFKTFEVENNGHHGLGNPMYTDDESCIVVWIPRKHILQDVLFHFKDIRPLARIESPFGNMDVYDAQQVEFVLQKIKNNELL
jgi:hypothetical protein